MATGPEKVPGNFHALYDQGTRAARGVSVASGRAERPEIARMVAEMPDAAVYLDEATQNPVQITAGRRPGRLSMRAASSPESAARQFVADRADLWQLNDQDIGTVDVVSVATRGLPTVRMLQKVDGVEVFQSDMTAALGADNSVVSVTGQLFHGAATAPSAGQARRGGFGSKCRVAAGAGSDRQSVVRSDRISLQTATISKLREPSHARTLVRIAYTTANGRPARQRSQQPPSRKRGMPVEPRRPKPHVSNGRCGSRTCCSRWAKASSSPAITSSSGSRDYPAFSYVIDAIDTPDVLFRKNLTSRVAFKYRVHNTGDALSGRRTARPPARRIRPASPTASRPPTIPEKLIEIESLLPGRPWLPAERDHHAGNNCIAYADLKRPTASARATSRARSRPRAPSTTNYDHAKPADDPTNLQNSLVGMFFHVNWLHDRWYEAGFDEASGNAQQDNFGLGGIGGDPILAEGNDFSGTDNANMSTPADGSSPRMQMFRFDGPNPMPEPHQQPRGADHLPRDGPLHHQPPGRKRVRA